MGDGIGDIIYIIVMIAALVFSIYKKAKASKHDGDVMPEHQVGDSPTESFPSFKDWFNDDEEEPEEIVRPQIQTMEAVPLKPNRLNYKKPEYKGMQKSDSLKRPERVTRITKRTVHNSLNPGKIAETFTYWDDEQLDLQKAIIYSEIIKRPII
jgi:hypothetical protein